MKTFTKALPRMAVAFLFLALPAVGQPRFDWTTNNGTITITGYPGPNGAATIPAIITDLPVTSIGSHAFSYSYVGSVTIPSSVTNIESGAFARCSLLTAIVVQSNNPAYSSVDGVLFNKNQTALAQYPAGKAGGQFTIPNSVASIGDEAFYGVNGFWGANPLTNVVIGNSVRNIGNGAFYYCWSLASVTIPSGVTNIGAEAFAACGLSAITVDALNPAYMSVGGVLFDKNQTALLQYPAGKTGIQYTIPNTVTNLGNSAFLSSRLVSVTIPNSVSSIPNGAFWGCDYLTNIMIPNSVTTIGNRALSGCWNLAGVTIPNSVTSIGNGAFAGCLSLTSVTIPNSVTSIGHGAFSDCLGLSLITVDVLNPAYLSVDGVLFNKSQTSVVALPAGKTGSQYIIPGSVTRIGNGAFADCANLASVTIPGSVTSIGNGAFAGCLSLTNITIPNSVTTIGDAAFSDSGLTSVAIPNSVTTIGDQAFSVCPFLTNVTIGNSVTTIGNDAFGNCYGLTNIVIGISVRNIGNDAFHYCFGLTNITIPDSVTTIGNGAFSHCRSLTSVTIPDSVTDLGGAAFAGCASLTSVTIGNGVSSLLPGWMDTFEGVRVAVGTFENCWSLTNVTVPPSVTSIGDSAFRSSGLTSITIPSSVTAIGDSAFSDCNSLASVTIPSSVTTIGDLAFAPCGSLSAIIVDPLNPAYMSASGVLFNKNQTVLIQYPIGNTGSHYTIPSIVTRIGNWAFSDCWSLTNVTIPTSVIRIGDSAFRSSGLTSITIPCSVTAIGDAAFARCYALTNVILPNSVTNIGNQMFFYCWRLANIAIPGSVTAIGDAAFAACYDLTSVHFQGNAPSLGADVFGGDDNATVFYLPGTTGWGATFGGRPTAPWVLQNPLILSSGFSFGVQSNRFGFIISWATNLPVVVEASTNHGNPTWSPLVTNTLNSGWSYFSDPQWADYPNRFYRVRSP